MEKSLELTDEQVRILAAAEEQARRVGDRAGLRYLDLVSQQLCGARDDLHQRTVAASGQTASQIPDVLEPDNPDEPPALYAIQFASAVGFAKEMTSKKPNMASGDIPFSPDAATGLMPNMAAQLPLDETEV